MQPLTHHSHRLQVNNPLPDLWHLLKQVSTSPPFQPPRRCSTLLMMVALGSPSSSTAYALAPLSWLQYFWWLQLPHLASHLSIRHPSALPPHNRPAVETRSPRASPLPKLEPGVHCSYYYFGKNLSPFSSPPVPMSSCAPWYLHPDSTDLLIWTPLPPTRMGNSLWSTTPMVFTQHLLKPPISSTYCLLSLFLIVIKGSGAKFSESILNSATHLHPFILLKYQPHF